MKKFLITIMLLLAVLILASCGNSKNGNKDTETTDSNTLKETASETTVLTTENETTDVEDEVLTYNVAMREIYVDYPSNKRVADGGEAAVFYNSRGTLTALAFDKYNEFTGELGGVPSFLNRGFCTEANPYCYSGIDGNELKITDSKEVKIAGFDSYNFTGTINNGVVDCYTYGYAFIIDNVPCMIVGLVSTPDQEQELIDDMIEEVDAMAATIRMER